MLIYSILKRILVTSFVINQFFLFKPIAAVAQSSSVGFGQFIFYDATAQVEQSTPPPFVQVTLNEVYPPPPSSNECQSIQIQPGNGCRIDNNGTQLIVSEISQPSRNLLVKNGGMEALLHFDQRSGSFNLSADTPAAESGEFRVADSTLNFEYEFTFGPASRFFRVSEIELSTVSGVSGAGIDLHLSLRNRIGTIWSESQALRFNDSRSVSRQTIDLTEFAQFDERIILSVELKARAVSATVQIGQDDPSLAALPSSASIDFRIVLAPTRDKGHDP